MEIRNTIRDKYGDDVWDTITICRVCGCTNAEAVDYLYGRMLISAYEKRDILKILEGNTDM